MTNAEVLLWLRLRQKPLDLRFRRQHPIGPYIADFACPMRRLVVELDGAAHSTNEEIARDAARGAFLKFRGWRILRFQNQDVYDHIEDVMETICRVAPSGRCAATSPVNGGGKSAGS
jgi:very-short-patch-repair endonuclease